VIVARSIISRDTTNPVRLARKLLLSCRAAHRLKCKILILKELAAKSLKRIRRKENRNGSICLDWLRASFFFSKRLADAPAAGFGAAVPWRRCRSHPLRTKCTRFDAIGTRSAKGKAVPNAIREGKQWMLLRNPTLRGDQDNPCPAGLCEVPCLPFSRGLSRRVLETLTFATRGRQC